MKKLTLTLDDLRVDSFETSVGRQERGTVIGEQQCTCNTQCGQNTCPGCPTCDYTCANTCPNTCWDTCDYTCGNTCGQYTCAYQLDPPFGPWYPCWG
jgi:hypothetical protein